MKFVKITNQDSFCYDCVLPIIDEKKEFATIKVPANRSSGWVMLELAFDYDEFIYIDFTEAIISEE